MKASFASVAGSVLVTAGVVVYLLLTEWTFWKGGDDPAPRGDQPEATTPDRGARSATEARKSAQDRDRQGAARAAGGPDGETGETGETGGETAATSAPNRREGVTVYRIDAPCACPMNWGLALETVEIDDQHTILTLLNPERKSLNAFPPGHENAYYLQESRYVNGQKPRHGIVEVRGLALAPAASSPTSFKLVFPRVPDQVREVKLAATSSNRFAPWFFNASLQREMPVAEWRRFEAYKTCGFDGPRTLPTGRPMTQTAHRHGDARGLRWSADAGLSVTGSGAQVTVTGSRAGTHELCLEATRGGGACRSCRTVEVIDQSGAPAPDFALRGCTPFPSRAPFWRFAVVAPEDGVEYRWRASGHATIRDREATGNATVVRPKRRPGEFTITVTAVHPGGEQATSQTFHNVYSCPAE